jgi:ankyrin repeat protein
MPWFIDICAKKQGVVDKKVLGVALHLAVAGRHTECCRVLLFSGADVDEKNSTGNTCMHVAAEAGSQEVMELLFEFQASLNIRNADGKCAIAVSKNPATRQLISGEVKR